MGSDTKKPSSVPADGNQSPRVGGKATPDDSAKTTTSGQLEDSQLAHIGTELRRMYDGLVQEPVPDRLLELLKQLDSSETADGSKSSGLRSSDDQERP
ncbi:NepR family anti-sigma factor [Algihabitans albus]|uniref:NepR family anti-sigma factor n=1 Tax=Algihabitans albus TaxID=2164067 RepID=UPI0038B2C1E9